jgi:hypothetical protein
MSLAKTMMMISKVFDPDNPHKEFAGRTGANGRSRSGEVMLVLVSLLGGLFGAVILQSATGSGSDQVFQISSMTSSGPETRQSVDRQGTTGASTSGKSSRTVSTHVRTSSS